MTRRRFSMIYYRKIDLNRSAQYPKWLLILTWRSCLKRTKSVVNPCALILAVLLENLLKKLENEENIAKAGFYKVFKFVLTSVFEWGGMGKVKG